MSKTINKILMDIENGIDFAGKGSIDPMDRVDFLKKEVCKYFASTPLVKRNEIIKVSKFISEIEFKAVINYRLERLTLERLMELKDTLDGVDNLSMLKEKARVEILKVGIGKIKISNQLRSCLESGDLKMFSIDGLIQLLEKCEIQNENTQFKKIG